MGYGIQACASGGTDLGFFLRNDGGEGLGRGITAERVGGIFTAAEGQGGNIKDKSGNDGAGILAESPSSVVTHDAVKQSPDVLLSDGDKARQLLEQCKMFLEYTNLRVNVNT